MLKVKISWIYTKVPTTDLPCEARILKSNKFYVSAVNGILTKTLIQSHLVVMFFFVIVCMYIPEILAMTKVVKKPPIKLLPLL